MARPIHIGYCVNRKMLKPLCVSVYSAAESAPEDRSLTIWVFHADLTDNDQRELFGVIQPHTHRCTLHFRQTDTTIFEGLNGLHGEVVPFGKALIPQMLDGEIDRLVYLDADTIVLGGIDELYDHDLGSSTIGAVSYETFGQAQQARFFSEQGLDLSEKAFNSGVLLIDVLKWNRLDITFRVVDLIKEHHNRYQGADQPILNLVFYKEFLPLRIRYNKRASASVALDASDTQDGIIHFVGLPKPFDVGGRWANKNYPLYEKVQRRACVKPLGLVGTLRNEGLLRTIKGLKKAFG